MARPPQADPAATRARIRGVASRVIAERGIAGTPLRAVAREAGVSVATVHHHFGSKEGLHEACIAALYEQLGALREELEGGLADSGGRASLETLVDEAVRRSFRFARREQDAVRLLMRTVLDAGELDAERRESFQLPFFDAVTELLGAALGRAPRTLRLPLQSVVHLVVRYALSSDDELARVAAVAPNDADRVHEDHLVAASRGLLDLPLPPAPS